MKILFVTLERYIDVYLLQLYDFCLCARARARACMCLLCYVCMHLRVRVCVYACIRACVHARVYVCMHACARMRARMRARVCLCVCVWRVRERKVKWLLFHLNELDSRSAWLTHQENIWRTSHLLNETGLFEYLLCNHFYWYIIFLTFLMFKMIVKYIPCFQWCRISGYESGHCLPQLNSGPLRLFLFLGS